MKFAIICVAIATLAVQSNARSFIRDPVETAKKVTADSLKLADEASKYGTSLGSKATQMGVDIGQKAINAEQEIASQAISGGVNLAQKGLDLANTATAYIPGVNKVMNSATELGKNVVGQAGSTAEKALTSANQAADKILGQTNAAVQKLLSDVQSKISGIFGKATQVSDSTFDKILSHIPAETAPASRADAPAAAPEIDASAAF